MIEPNVKTSCKNCDADVTWATTNNGKRTLLDEAPSSDGDVAFMAGIGDADGQELAVKLHGKALTEARAKGIELRTCHFLTCPERQEQRAA